MNTQALHHFLQTRALRGAVAGFALGGLALLTACAPDVHARGNLPPQATIDQLVPGESSRNQVLSLLGTPSTTSLFDGGETWYYIGARTQQYAVYANEEIERQIVAIRFDSTGRIADLTTMGKDDGTEMAVIERETPTEGTSLTIIEQFIGNIGRFSKPPGT